MELINAVMSHAVGTLTDVKDHWEGSIVRGVADAVRDKRSTLVIDPLPEKLHGALSYLHFFAEQISFATGTKSDMALEIESEIGHYGSISGQLSDEPLAWLCAIVDIDLRRRAAGLDLSDATAATLGVTTAELSFASLSVENFLLLETHRDRGRPQFRDSSRHCNGVWLGAMRRSGIFTPPVLLKSHALATGVKATAADRKYWSRHFAKYDPSEVAPLLEHPDMAPISVGIPRRF